MMPRGVAEAVPVNQRGDMPAASELRSWTAVGESIEGSGAGLLGSRDHQLEVRPVRVQLKQSLHKAVAAGHPALLTERKGGPRGQTHSTSSGGTLRYTKGTGNNPRRLRR